MTDRTVVIGTVKREDGTEVRYVWDTDDCRLHGECECGESEATG